MIVLASMIVAVAIMPGTSSRATRSIGHVPLLDALPVGGHRVRSGARYTPGELVAEARGVGAPGQQLQPAGRMPTSSASSRRAVTSGGSPSHVALAGRDLEQPPVDGRPVLADQHHRRRAAGDGHDRHRAGVAHHVPLEPRRRRGARSVAVGDGDHPARGSSSRSAELYGSRARGRRCRADGASGPRPGPGRRRPAPRNSGWGRSGRLLNSGWAWVPTQNGWPGSSMNSTSRPSGEMPEHTSPASSSRAR